MRSALRTVETRCEMKMVVRPRITSRRWLRILSSVWVSTLESASSRIRISRIANEGASDCGALLLSAGERDAALADHGVIAFGKAFDVSCDVGRFRRVVNVLIGGRVDAEGDIFADAVAEQESLLRHESDVLAQRGERVFADGESIDQNRAGRGVVDARDEADESRLARTGRADYGETGACGHAQIQVVQNLLAIVGKVEAAELDLAGDLSVVLVILRAGSILNLGLLAHDLVDADEGSGSALEDVDDPPQRDDRPGELHHVSAEGDKLSHAHRTREMTAWS